MITKICYKCKIEKPLAEFSKSKIRPDGHNSDCKDCHKEYRRQYYLKNKKKEKQNSKKSWSNNKVQTNCSECGKSLERHRTNVSPEKNNFCNYKCSIKFYDRESDPYKYLFSTIRRRAKVKKLKFDLTKEYLKELMYNQNNKCVVTNIPIKVIKQNEVGTLADTASLDRIDNSKGYEKGNVRFTCLGINYMRNRRSNDELVDLLSKIIKYKKS